MIHSMTGYGKAVCEIQGRKISVEIKSLNSKSFDLMMRIPQIYKEKEMDVRQLINKCLDRGKIDFSINVESELNERNTKINPVVVGKYLEQLRDISGKFNLNTPDDKMLQIILRLPDVLNSEANEFKPDEWQLISIAISEAIDMLICFRAQEGLVLEADVKNRVELILSYLDQIEQYEKARIENIRTRIKTNINEFICNLTLDQNRLEQELIYYIEKIDITEEKVRLKNHCVYFNQTLEEQFAGKKLGFIAQEIGREINTIGSKANDHDIQKLVVQMKDELEKIKEQLMNIL